MLRLRISSFHFPAWIWFFQICTLIGCRNYALRHFTQGCRVDIQRDDSEKEKVEADEELSCETIDRFQRREIIIPSDREKEELVEKVVNILVVAWNSTAFGSYDKI